MNSVIRFTEINEAVYGYIFHLKLVLEFFMINFGIQQSMGQATTKKVCCQFRLRIRPTPKMLLLRFS